MLTHTWIEQYRKTQPQITEALAAAVQGAVQFNCGDADAIPVAKGADFSEAKAPYQATLLQFETPEADGYSHIIVLWLDQEDGSAVVMGAQRARADKEWRTIAPCRVTRYGDGFHYEKAGYSDESKEAAMLFHAMALNLFFVLGCSNVAAVDNQPPAALNKKRAKAGKFPLLSYKTLVVVVDEARTTSQPMGGTHSSPRVHLRRGHIRRLGSGRRVWVQSCVVGSKHGMVLKDYRVTTKAAMGSNG